MSETEKMPLNFKTGLYGDTYKLSNGDFGFAILDNTSNIGTIVIKQNNKLYNLMPVPGAINKPLVGTGENTSPRYTTLTVSGGGTGKDTLTDGGLLVGAGSSSIETIAPVDKGKILVSNGTNLNPIFLTPSMSWTPGGSSGPIFNYIINGVQTTGSAIPSASVAASGIVTTGKQSFSGEKTFYGNIIAGSNNAYDIGSSSYNWKEAYIRSVISNNDLILQSASANYIKLKSYGGKTVTLDGPTADTTFLFPNTGGTFVTHATRGEGVGGATCPVYVANTGRVTACIQPNSETSWFIGVPFINTGEINIGRVINFHSTSTTSYSTQLITDHTTATATNQVYLPKIDGRLVTHTKDTDTGDSGLPVYVDADGKITRCTGSSIFSSFSSSDNTLSATIAGEEKSANLINDIELSWGVLNSDTSRLRLQAKINGVYSSSVVVPPATASMSGVISTGDQTFNGNKTFQGNIITKGDITPETTLTYDLGSSSKVWSETHTKKIIMPGNILNPAIIQSPALQIEAPSSIGTSATMILYDSSTKNNSTGVITYNNFMGLNCPLLIESNHKEGLGLDIKGGNISLNTETIANSTTHTTVDSRNLLFFAKNSSTSTSYNRQFGRLVGYINTSGLNVTALEANNTRSGVTLKTKYDYARLSVVFGASEYNSSGTLVYYGYIVANAPISDTGSNDYAEYRKSLKAKTPGQVIIETGYGDLTLSTERLQPGANIISDTYGFLAGTFKKDSVPVAVAGRVLAYTFEDRNSYNPGDAVCSGPGGTVSKMSREEIKEYPERILGTVSEIPDYEIWEESSRNVEVNGRIWIKIR